MDGRIQAIEKDISSIKENHLAHIERDLRDLGLETAKQGVDLDWLKKNHWKITVGVLMTFIASAIGALISYI